MNISSYDFVKLNDIVSKMFKDPALTVRFRDHFFKTLLDNRVSRHDFNEVVKILADINEDNKLLLLTIANWSDFNSSWAFSNAEISP